MTKLRKNEYVAMPILDKICKTLDVDYGDIMEYVPDKKSQCLIFGTYIRVFYSWEQKYKYSTIRGVNKMDIFDNLSEKQKEAVQTIDEDFIVRFDDFKGLLLAI